MYKHDYKQNFMLKELYEQMLTYTRPSLCKRHLQILAHVILSAVSWSGKGT